MKPSFNFDLLVNKIYDKGWIQASRWAGRLDLLSDMDSKIFTDEREAAIGHIRDALKSMMKEDD